VRCRMLSLCTLLDDFPFIHLIICSGFVEFLYSSCRRFKNALGLFGVCEVDQGSLLNGLLRFIAQNLASVSVIEL
jgi:hypothetical protein